MLCLGAPRLEASDLQQLDAQQFGARFKVASKLGQGAFADVLCVKDAEHNQQLAALKVLKPPPAALPAGLALSRAPVQRMSSFNSPGAQAPEVSLFREARALKHSKHPNVVELHSVVHIPKACVTDASTSRSAKRPNTGHCWGILIELLQGGSLQQQVYKVMAQPHSSAYSYVDALTWACDIASAVAHLHSLNPVVIHRDLKLENILLRKTPAQSPPGCRKLPTAKLTDFGLHVMIDRPPAPFFITTGEDGMPLLILQQDTDDQQQKQDGAQQQQQQQQDTTLPPGTQQLTVEAGGAADGDQVTRSSSNASTPDAYAIADAEARVAPAGSKSSATSKPSFSSALKGTHQQQQQQQQPKQVAFAVEASTAPASDDAAAAADDTNSAPLPSTGAVPRPQHNSHLQRLSPEVTSSADILGSSPGGGQWRRLTAGTLHRLSVDSWSNNSGSLPCPAGKSAAAVADGTRTRRTSMEQRAIPLMLQPPAIGQSGSFVNAAVPELALASEAQADDVADPAAAVMAVGSPQHSRSSSGIGSGAAESALSGVEVIGGGSISSILAAANSQKDYEVTFRPASLKSSHLAAHRRQGASSNPYARSSQQSDAGAAAGPAGSHGTGEDDRATNGTPSECGMSARSGEWPTAASMMWEDLMEDEVEQELLLDGGVPAVGTTHGGPLIELPLSYNLTGHTGSFMYMAPEVYKRKPYNESVDVFSMGVMFYELFSRSLLIYTHTPANSPADCETYAARISEGFRPKRVKCMTGEVWKLIEDCWDQDPGARPAAKDVLTRLQRLLAQAQAAEAAKGPKGFEKLFGGRASLEQSAVAPSQAAGTAGAAGQAASAADPAAQKLAGMPAQKAGVEIAGVPGREAAHARAEPACGCVIC